MQAQLARIFGNNNEPVAVVDEDREHLETDGTPSLHEVVDQSQQDLLIESEINIAQANMLETSQ